MTKTLRSSSEPVLQARYVGQAPDLRHPLAPPEHVFECDEPRRPRTTWLQRAIVLWALAGCVCLAGIYIFSAVAQKWLDAESFQQVISLSRQGAGVFVVVQFAMLFLGLTRSGAGRRP